MNLWPMPPATSGTRQQSPHRDGEPMWSMWKASPLRHALACPHRTHRELQCHPVHWYLPTGMADRSDRSKKKSSYCWGQDGSRWVKMGQDGSRVFSCMWSKVLWHCDPLQQFHSFHPFARSGRRLVVFLCNALSSRPVFFFPPPLRFFFFFTAPSCAQKNSQDPKRLKESCPAAPVLVQFIAILIFNT